MEALLADAVRHARVRAAVRPSGAPTVRADADRARPPRRRPRQASWAETAAQLRGSSRWSRICDTLSEADRERIFRRHIDTLRQRDRAALDALFDALPEVDLQCQWPSVRMRVMGERAARQYLAGLQLDSADAEDVALVHAFDEYLRQREARAVRNVQQLFCEVREITYRTQEAIAARPKHRLELIALLERDQRWLKLAPREALRQRLLDAYIDELARRGPPLPPTANPEALAREAARLPQDHRADDASSAATRSADRT